MKPLPIWRLHPSLKGTFWDNLFKCQKTLLILPNGGRLERILTISTPANVIKEQGLPGKKNTERLVSLLALA